ncbi:ribonuclease P protein component [Chromatium okenii]|uniref:ribonuclease P protein component n=1 Tax=Chromatium okenii TaxID=61644 RepID=UPI0030841675
MNLTGFPLRQPFAPAQRLRHTAQFKRVFAQPLRTGKTGFVILSRANDIGSPRLGLAISKKCARRAVDRNRLKRIARESFRLHAHSISGVDIVILCAQGALTMSNQQLFLLLARAWITIGTQSCVNS